MAASKSSSKSSGGGGGGAAITKDSSGGGNSSAAVNTAYYQGDLNKDAKNGTFANGYQPDNVGGKKLSKTGDSITFKTQTLSGQTQTVTQNIWKTSDGKKYYWDGRYNKYIRIDGKTNSSALGSDKRG